MGGSKESLHAFLQELIRAPKDAKRRAERGAPFTYKTTIKTDRFDPEIGDVEVRGQIDPWFGDPVIYSASGLNLQVASFGQQRGGSIFDPLQRYTGALRGDEVEVNTSTVYKSDLIPFAHWDGWKDGKAGKAYREGIYPKARKVISTEVSSWDNHDLICVDLFGGDGEFGESLASILPNNGESSEIHVLDGHDKSLQAADSRFTHNREGRFVVHRPVDLTRVEDIFPDISSPDIVTILGGLCEGIVTRDEALDIARKVFEGMREDGLFVVSGYTPVLLSGSDFSGTGFKVKQMSVPENALSFTPPYQMYVMRK